MPINLTALGGPSWGHNVDNLDSNQAREVLDRIQRHLSQNGKAEGTLTLFNRYNREGELTLERKSGFQLIGRGTRIRDTNEVLKTLLQKAGFPEAEAELKQHLTTRNGVGAAKMLEILKRQVHVEAGKGEAKAFVQRSHQSDNPRAQLESRLQTYQNQLANAHREQTPNLRPQQEVARLQGKIAVLTREIKSLELPGVRAPSFDALLREAEARVSRGEDLGQGAFAAQRNAGKGNLILETYSDDSKVILSNSRSQGFNETIAAYLTSRSNHQDYNVNVAQPRFFLVKERGGEEHRMVTPLELRTLLKATPEDSWECVGLLMPEIKGGNVQRLSDMGVFTKRDQKQIIKGTLESVMKLNERGFIHRDLKPANMHFDASSGTTTLLNNGLMHKTSKNKPETRYPAGKFGTLMYMHPRVQHGEPCGTETDLYATAVMALELAHPGAGKKLSAMMAAEYATTGHLNPRGALNREVKDGIYVFRGRPRIVEGEEAVAEMRKALRNPKSLTSFAVACLERADRPAKDWADRAKAQRVYAQLLQHPSLQNAPRRKLRPRGPGNGLTGMPM